LPQLFIAKLLLLEICKMTKTAKARADQRNLILKHNWHAAKHWYGDTTEFSTIPPIVSEKFGEVAVSVFQLAPHFLFRSPPPSHDIYYICFRQISYNLRQFKVFERSISSVSSSEEKISLNEKINYLSEDFQESSH
jgi:hypothetical protein